MGSGRASSLDDEVWAISSATAASGVAEALRRSGAEVGDVFEDDDGAPVIEFMVHGSWFNLTVTPTTDDRGDEPEIEIPALDEGRPGVVLDVAAGAAVFTPPIPEIHTDSDLAGWLNSIDREALDSEHRRVWEGLDDGNWSGDAYRIAVAFDEPVSDPAHLIAYYMRGPMGMGSDGFDGDWAGAPINPSMEATTASPHPRSRVWVFPIDMTKSSRDDVGIAIEGFKTHMLEGSPVRKTDRSGPGTAGTRAVPGVAAGSVFVALA